MNTQPCKCEGVCGLKASPGSHLGLSTHCREQGASVRVITCGCCTNGCVCEHHQDIPLGMQPKRCDLHAAA